MLRRLALFFLLLIVPLASIPASAQDAKLSKAQLDQLLAPIALFPDELLASVLVGATYPLQVVQAARWRAEPGNARLQGDALSKALEQKDWDPSIKSLVFVPDTLKRMSDELDWTEKVGDAFLAQQAEVMDQIQLLRRKALETGSLVTNERQRVTKDEDDIVIRAAEPGIVYAPVYNTSEVYGPWWHDDYPPYDWTWAGAPLAGGYFWGTAAIIAGAAWGWGDFDWRRRDVRIDVARWNRINSNRPQITDNRWKHNPAHRGAVPYKSEAVRNRFDGSAATGGQVRDRAAGKTDRPRADQRSVKSQLGDATKKARPADATSKGAKGSEQKQTQRSKSAKAAGSGKTKPQTVSRAKPSPKVANTRGGAQKGVAVQKPAKKATPPSRSMSASRNSSHSSGPAPRPGRTAGGGGGGRRGGRR